MQHKRPVLRPYRYLGQNYRWIRLKQRIRGQPWVDPLFPPSATSLGPRFANRPHIVWRRPWEVTRHACFSSRQRRYKQTGVIQGAIGNCWLVTTIGLVARRRGIMRRLVPDINDQDWSQYRVGAPPGVYRFQFYRLGRWVEVVVDDLLPYDATTGQLVFARSTDSNEFWVSLLEKAYAKLHGSYDALDAGSTADAILDFTSAAVESWRVMRPPTLPPGIDYSMPGAKQLRQEWVEMSSLQWRELRKQVRRGALTSCAMMPPELNDLNTPHDSLGLPLSLYSQHHPVMLPDGLMTSHSYGILDAVECGNHPFLLRMFSKTKQRPPQRLLLLMDPWGEARWKGHWCSTAHRDWDSLPWWQKGSLRARSSQQNGTFWMSFDDFLTRFDILQVGVCMNSKFLSFHRRWVHVRYPDCWSTEDGTAGGCTNFVNSIENNPQYLIVIDHESDMLVSLQQGHRLKKTPKKAANQPAGRSKSISSSQMTASPWTATASDAPDFHGQHSAATHSYTTGAALLGDQETGGNLVIGFVIMRVEENRTTRLKDPRDVTATSPYRNSREVTLRLRLPAGRYIVLPTTYAPGEESDFLLRIFTKRHIRSMRILPPKQRQTWWQAQRLQWRHLFCQPSSPTRGLVSGNRTASTGHITIRIIQAVFPRSEAEQRSDRKPFRRTFISLNFTDSKPANCLTRLFARSPLRTRSSRVAWADGAVAVWNADYLFPVSDPLHARLDLKCHSESRLGRTGLIGHVKMDVHRFSVAERANAVWEIVMPILDPRTALHTEYPGTQLEPVGTSVGQLAHIVLRVCYHHA